MTEYQQPKSSVNTYKKKNHKTVIGVVNIIIGLAIYLWASSHSPHMDFGEMLMKYDSYIIKEPIYTIIILIAAALGLGGLIILIKDLTASSNK